MALPCALQMASRKNASILEERIVGAVDAASGVSNVLSALDRLIPTRNRIGVKTQERLARSELYSTANTQTPYGLICRTSTVMGKSGELQVYHVNPFALLQHSCEVSIGFRCFLANVVASAPDALINLVFYLDKATPGNEKRPDHGRSAQCIYFTVLQFPHWFRSRRNGWIPFAYVYAKDQLQADLTDAMLVRFLVRIFEPENSELSFSNGFGVRGTAGSVTVVRASDHLIVADWDQHVRTFSLKGYSGRIPCSLLCKNVLGRCLPFEHTYLVHVSSADYEKFDKHSKASLEEVTASVEQVAQTQPHRLDITEKNTGFKWDPEGLLWDGHVRAKLQPPYSQYPDWMHNLVASGGVAQYHLNGLVLHLCHRGLTLKDIDAWIATVKKPKGMDPFPREFFQTRIVHKANAHIRAFASEVIGAFVLLGFFVDVVVAAMPSDDLLQQHIACLNLMRIMLGILMRADRRQLETLRNATQMHHRLYMSLYHVTPKLHFQSHVSDFWEYWGMLLSCFGPERKHRFFKRVMKFSNKTGNRTALAYDVRLWVKNLCREAIFAPIHFVGKERPCVFGSVVAVAWGVRTEKGLLSKGDLLQYEHNDQSYVGFALGFARTSSQHYVAIIRPCTHVEESIWRRQHCGFCMPWLSDVAGSCPYLTLDNGDVAPLMHARN